MEVDENGGDGNEEKRTEPVNGTISTSASEEQLVPTPSSPFGNTKRRVSYFYDSEVGNFHYGETHPMKPHRVRMAHHLIVNYGLYQDLEVFQPELISKDELTKFHSDDYVQFLSTVTTDNMHQYMRQLQRCKTVELGETCFDPLS